MYEDMEDYIENDENLSAYEIREKYDYEVHKPLSIEQAIRSKKLRDIRDELLIYACGVDGILDETFFPVKPPGVDNILKFLRLAVETNNLHVLRAVWLYGVEIYFNRNKKWWSEVFIYIAKLIQKRDYHKMLKYMINQVSLDNKKITIEVNKEIKSLSGAKRRLIIGNLLDVAVYYNNLEAIELLLPKQVTHSAYSLKAIMEDDIKKYFVLLENTARFGFNHFYIDNYSINTLYSENPIAYALDSGNIEAMEILLQNGYKIDFDADDFSYQLANFGHSKSIQYLSKYYPDEILNLDIEQVLRATNYNLLKIMLNMGYKLKPEDFIQIFVYNDTMFDFKDNEKQVKLVNKKMEKCAKEFEKRNIKVNDILIGLVHSFSTKSYEFLDLCIRLYSSDKELDVTKLLCHIMDIEMLSYLAKKVKLYCFADKIITLFHIGVRDFKNLLKIIDFKCEDSSTINEFTIRILDLNAETAIKLLIENNFITAKNYSSAVDYIVNNGLDKLLAPLITNSKNIGGINRSYDI